MVLIKAIIIFIVSLVASVTFMEAVPSIYFKAVVYAGVITVLSITHYG